MVMETREKTALIVCLVFLVAFVFRVAILFRSEYPPSTDIGLHSNILNLILDSGEVPTWNPYHMGGEPLTNTPGFYLFASFLVLFTGMPQLTAQVLLASLFSAFMVFPAYLIARKIWKNKNIGLLAAFFVAVSTFSFEMLGWGGYPNIVSLTLIGIVVFVFLKNSSQPHFFKLIITALLLGCLAITHLLSFFVLLAVWIGYIALVHIAKAFRLTEVKSLRTIGFFFASVALSALFISPWLLRVWDFYVDMSAQGVFVGGMEENRALILAYRRVDVNILVFSLALVLLIFMFRASRGKYVDDESLMFIALFFVPLALTQAYVFGIITDYLRFMYYVDMPGLLTLAASLFFASKFIAAGFRKLSMTKWNRPRSFKAASTVALPAILIITYFVSPLSLTPAGAVTRTEFYTTVKTSEATAMNWIQQRTPEQARLVTDHLYGWWLSGVAKRSTLSAVSPEFLLYPNEIEVAKSALILLDTDFYFDNGLIQVREDGGYFARHNPIFIINSQLVPYSVLHFNDSEVTLFFQQGAISQTLDLDEVKLSETQFTTNDGNVAVLSIVRENEFLRVNKTLIVRRGVRFAELSYEVESKDSGDALNWMRFIVHMRQGRSVFNNQSLSIFDYNAMVKGQIVFKEIAPETRIYTSESPSSAEFLYSLNSSRNVKIGFLIGLYDVKEVSYNQILDTLGNLPNNPLQVESESTMTATSYLEIVRKYSVTFVVCRDKEMYPKFLKNPKFRTLYNSVEVAVFQVAD
jgi:hypothetical protein